MSWTQPDPLLRGLPEVGLETPRNHSLYAFSLNNPVRFVDPLGLSPTDEAGPRSIACDPLQDDQWWIDHCEMDPYCETAVIEGEAPLGSARSSTTSGAALALSGIQVDPADWR